MRVQRCRVWRRVESAPRRARQAQNRPPRERDPRAHQRDGIRVPHRGSLRDGGCLEQASEGCPRGGQGGAAPSAHARSRRGARARSVGGDSQDVRGVALASHRARAVEAGRARPRPVRRRR